jgi:hypothetical protein
VNVLAQIQSLFEAASAGEDTAGLLSTWNLDVVEGLIREQGTQLGASGDTSDDAIATMEILGWALDQIESYRASIEASAADEAARAETAAAVAARFAAPAEPEATEPVTTEPEAAAESTVEPPVEAVAAATETPAPPVPAAATAVEVEPVAPTPAAEAAETAAAARVPAMEVITPPGEHSIDVNGSKVTITAGADIPMYGLGQPFPDFMEVAKAMVSRRSALGTGGRGVSGERVLVAHMDYLDTLPQASDDPQANAALMRQAAEVAGQPEALTASGGFCAPSETIYDFQKINKPTDLVQQFLPTIGAPRGSLQYPDSPDIRDAFTAGPSHAYTEANDIAEVQKSVTVFDCPDFVECTVEAQYEIIQWGNFGTRAYPEWVAHWMGLTSDVHAHKVSEKLITGMVNLSSAEVGLGPSGGATATFLSGLMLAGADYRHDLRTGRGAPLDVLCPEFIYDMIRADLIRSGSKTALEAFSVTDAQINGWVGAAGMRLNPVVDWQAVSANSATGATTFPAHVNVLIYTPGTFVRADMGTLNLGLVRDSVLNKANDYTIFAESFEQVCKPGIESRNYRIDTCVTGEFSERVNLLCSGIGPATS